MKYSTWSVRKLKNRKGQPWQGVLKYKNAEGKWCNKSKVFPEAKGKKEAERLTEAWFDELNAESEKREESSYTLNDAVLNYIELQYNKNLIEASTLHFNKNKVANYIEPYIGNLVFAEVERHDLEAWITELHKKGLKQSTIYASYSILRKAYTYYYKMGDIPHNPCVITVPKGKPRQSHMTGTQMTEFVSAVNKEYRPEDKMYLAIYLAYYGGLRRSEICGLRYRDIDLTANTISITSAVGIGDDGTYMKNPKNRSSERTFDLVPQLKEILTYHYNYYRPEPSYFVIGKDDEYLSPDALGNRFAEFVAKYELKDAFDKPLTLHSLRHNLGFQGARTIDISSLSHIFGHANRSITLDTYGSTDANAVKMAIEQLGKAYESHDFKEDD